MGLSRRKFTKEFKLVAVDRSTSPQRTYDKETTTGLNGDLPCLNIQIRYADSDSLSPLEAVITSAEVDLRTSRRRPIMKWRIVR